MTKANHKIDAFYERNLRLSPGCRHVCAAICQHTTTEVDSLSGSPLSERGSELIDSKLTSIFRSSTWASAVRCMESSKTIQRFCMVESAGPLRNKATSHVQSRPCPRIRSVGGHLSGRHLSILFWTGAVRVFGEPHRVVGQLVFI